MAESTEAGAPTTLRLLEPKALRAADRFGARVVERAAPLMRAVTTGSLGFSERLFHYWIGRNLERPPMARVANGPSAAAMPFPRPWYDEPPATAWPARGITLRAPAPARPSDATALGTQVVEPRAIDFVASYVEAPFGEVAAVPAERVVAPAARAAIASRPSVVSRLLDRLDAVDTLLRGPRPAFTSAPSPREPIEAPPATLPWRSQRSGPAIVYVEAGPEAPERPRDVFARPAQSFASTPVATVRATTPVLGGGASAATVAPASSADPRIARGAAASPQTTLSLDATLPIAVAWPSVHRFLETLAGPSALLHAGIVAPTIAERFAPQTIVPAGTLTRAVPSLARELIAPASVAHGDAPAPSAAVVPSQQVRAATALGELRQVRDAAPATFEPGRLAQQAELLGRVAETRVARQLGFVPEAPPRSVLWSADAFTFVAPDVFAQPDSSIASVASAVSRPSSAPAIAPLGAATSGLAFTQSGPVLPPAEVAAAPRSIAGVLSFVERQLGARLARDMRALSVAAPDVVYVQASADAAPTATHSARAEAPKSFVASSPIAMPAALDAPQTDAGAPGAFGRVAMRSEQIAGEVGVRIGALASEFLIDPHGNADASQGYAPQVSQLDGSQRPWLSTQEWVLLSMFPSTATAHEVAASASRRGWPAADAPSTSLARDPGALPVVAPAAGTQPPASGREGATGPRGSLSLPSLRAGLRQHSQLGVAGTDTAATIDGDGSAAPHMATATAEAMSHLVAPAPSPAPPRAQLTQRLPDGRAPRGSRLFPRVATPVVAPSVFSDGGSATPLLAGSEAAERRVESPVGSPLWGHLRPMVAPTGPVATASSSGVSHPAAGRQLVVPQRRVPEPTARSVAMELIAPFVEAARAEPTTSAASFARAETPVVTGSAPDAATRSLVTALAASQAAGAQSGGDRLTMADLTLISFVSQTQQVAAAAEGDSAVSVGPSGPASSSSAGGAGGGGQGFDDSDVERLAERVHDRLRSRAQDLAEQKGDDWER